MSNASNGRFKRTERTSIRFTPYDSQRHRDPSRRGTIVVNQSGEEYSSAFNYAVSFVGRGFRQVRIAGRIRNLPDHKALSVMKSPPFARALPPC